MDRRNYMAVSSVSSEMHTVEESTVLALEEVHCRRKTYIVPDGEHRHGVLNDLHDATEVVVLVLPRGVRPTRQRGVLGRGIDRLSVAVVVVSHLCRNDARGSDSDLHSA